MNSLGDLTTESRVLEKLAKATSQKMLKCDAKQHKYDTNKYEINSNTIHIEEQRY